MSKVPVSVDVGLSAKAELKTEIPSESSGRFLEALTDIFRPFSEVRGLKADQIRLQREDVLIKIANKARERLAIEGKVPSGIPNKTLIPLLEKASLSDPDDDVLLDAWANVLTSASKGEQANHPIFIDVLGKLDSAHLKFLEFLAIPEDNENHPDQFLTLTEHDVREILSCFCAEVSKKLKDFAKDTERLTDPFSDEIDSYFRRRGSCLIAGGFTILSPSDAGEYGEIVCQRNFRAYPEIISGALESLNIIRRFEIHDFNYNDITIWIAYHTFTLFGLEFFYTCHSGENVLA